MNVLVAGGTGFIGQALCRELDDRGHDVTALSRSPGDADLPAGVEPAMGDVTAYDSIESAFAGQDAVVNLVALTALYEPKGGNRKHFEVHLGGTENVVRAAETHDVEHVLQMSALGADPDGPTAYIRAKGQAEDVVRESDLDWTITRPSVVFGDGSEILTFPKRLKRMVAPGLPVYPLPGGGRTPFQPIWVGDFAPMLADCLEDDTHRGATYEFGGPEVLTLREVVDLVYEAEGRDVTVISLPMPLARIGLTVLGAVPGFPMGPDQYRSLQFDNTVAENDVTAFGVNPADLRSLADYLGIGRPATPA